jgi:hypothetical protein
MIGALPAMPFSSALNAGASCGWDGAAPIARRQLEDAFSGRVVFGAGFSHDVRRISL